MNERISIIIPSYNTRDLTRRCIQTIYRHPPRDTLKVIVVDNHSSDNTAEMLKQDFPDVKLIVNDRNLGFSRACNAGAKLAEGEFLLFLNSDTEPTGDCLQRLADWLASHPKTGIVGPTLIGPANQLQQMSWNWHPILGYELIQQYFAPYAVRHSSFRQNLIRRLQRKSRSVPSLCGACIMVRRRAFEAIGGFDEDFELYFEDSDLCWRSVHKGWGIDFIAEAQLLHHLGQSTRGSWSLTSLIYQQSHVAFYRKHAPRWGLTLLKIYLILKWLRLMIVTRFTQDHADQARRYSETYSDIIFERRKITLSAGYE